MTLGKGKGLRAPPKTAFKPGHPGGPGRPKGSRHAIAESFLNAICRDFAEHGAKAIAAARAESPLGYVRVVASLLPQKIEVSHAVSEMTDEALMDIIRNSRVVIDTPGSRAIDADGSLH